MTPGSRRPVPVAVILILAGALAGACGAGGASSAAGTDTLRVLTTTTVLADLVTQVGGSRVTVDSLVPRGGEVHTFDPTPSDLRRLADADIVFINGLGLDQWLADLVTDVGTEAPVIELAEDLEGVEYLEGDAHDGDVPGANPHLWLDAAYAAKYADRIAVQLAASDPAHASEYRAGLAAYAAVLEELDATAVSVLGAIPEADRTVISFHDAFPYFAAAYGLRIDGTVVDAPGQDPSAGELSDLIRAVKANGVRAIFAEAQFNEELVRTIADETGAVVVSSLYTDSVGDPPQDTYVGLMTWNIEQVAKALRGD